MKDRGFTLIEVIMGIVIFAVVVVGGYNLFSYGTEFIERAARKDLAIQLASAKMEHLKGVEELKDEAGYYDYDQPYEFSGVEYDIEVSVDIGTYTVVSLTATWTGSHREEFEREELGLITILSK